MESWIYKEDATNISIAVKVKSDYIRLKLCLTVHKISSISFHSPTVVTRVQFI